MSDKNSDGGCVPVTPCALPLCLLACALTGGAALTYEVAWTHAIALAVGNSSRALAVVLAGFLGGMAIGGWLAGRGPVRRRRPLLACGVLELFLGACGLAYPMLLASLPEAVATMVRAGMAVDVARLLVVAGVLLPPTVAMGVTFPLWVRAISAGDPGRVGRSAALVAASQVMGAATGAFLAGFVVVPTLGYAAASQMGGVVGAVVGLVLIKAGRGSSAPAEEEARVASDPPAPSRGTAVAGMAFLACGFASIGYQVVWTRGLVFFFDGFHFAFSAVLVSFLLGLGIGSAVVAGVAPRVRQPAHLLAATQVLCGVFGFVTLIALPWLAEPALEAAREPSGYPLRVLLLSALLLVLPAAMIGTTLPLAIWIATRTVGRLADGLSRAYAQVTLGNAIAAASVPLLLIPMLGIRSSWSGLVVLNGIAALLLARGRLARGSSVAVVGLGCAAVAWTLADPRPLILSSHVFTGRVGSDRELVHCRDGESCTVAVVKDLNRGATVLYTDTFAAASTGREYPYMRLLGHLPTLLVERPRRAIVICFGTGTTAGAVSLHEEVETLRVVDVEREVFTVADAFRDVNHGVLDGREGLDLQTVVEDGRLDLLCAEAPFDVITLEPLMPYTLNAVPFYTEEFYRLAKDRLSTGGVLCQWIPVHAIPLDDYKSLVRTFLEVFPGGHLFFFEQSSLLVARRGGGPVSWETLAERAARPGIAADLREALVSSPQDLLAAHVATGETLLERLDDVDVVRDDWPWIAFRTVRPEANPRRPLHDTLGFLVDCFDGDGEADLAADLVGLSQVDRIRVEKLADVRRGLLRGRLIEAGIWLRGAETGEGVSFRPALDAYGEAVAPVPDHLEGARLIARLSHMLERRQALSELVAGQPLAAFHRLDRFRGLPEWDIGSDAMQGLALLAAGDVPGALAVARGVTARHPRHPLGVAVLERAAAEVGDRRMVDAARSFERGVDAERLRARRLLVERVRDASRRDGSPPLQALRERLDRVCRSDLLVDPGRAEQARAALGVEPNDRLLPLLGAAALRELEADDPPASAVRAVVVLGVGRAVGRLRALAETHPGRAVEFRRAEAALVPRDTKRVEFLASDPDVVVRRFITAFAADRGYLKLTTPLLSSLLDLDADVRLYGDRALRRLTGKNAQYDYLAPEADRQAAIERWVSLLSR
ncbi:MAG: fused MFS/spermidine synthase [Planctomycetes bacterium]|nr:fused MFS/spermidine synthase [Planctomycetota bacterium]